MRPLAAVFLVLSSAPALSAERDVRWFADRPAVLDQTLRACHGNARRAATWDCQNAEGASSLRRARRLGATPLPEPDYNKRTNPFAYYALLGACTKREPGSEMYWRSCHRLNQAP